MLAVPDTTISPPTAANLEAERLESIAFNLARIAAELAAVKAEFEANAEEK